MNQPPITLEDSDRLSGQCKRLMAHADGIYRSLKEWADLIQGTSESGVSARIRQVNTQFGYIKEKKNLGHGLWVYKLLPPTKWEGEQGVFL